MPDPAPILEAAEVRTRAARVMALPESTYPDEDIEQLVAEFEEVFVDYRGVYPTPREITEVVTVPSCSSVLILAWPEVSDVDSVTVNGTALTASSYTLEGAAGMIRYNGSFSPSYPATVVYTHGLAAVPEVLKRACARYVASVLKADATLTGRDTLTQNVDGATTRYATPNKAEGRPTGWLEIDRLLNTMPDYRSPGIG